MYISKLIRPITFTALLLVLVIGSARADKDLHRAPNISQGHEHSIQNISQNGMAKHDDVHHKNHENRESQSDTTVKHVGVVERLGEKVPLDLTFMDSDNQEIRLGDLLDMPTLVLPVYYSCPRACLLMLGSLSSSIPKIPLELGTGYRVIALSFDDEETAKIAHQAKFNYTKRLGAGFDPKSWRFLTGQKEQVQRFTKSIGYHFKKTGKHAFLHPNAIVVLAADGTIIRYLYNPPFLPFDMGMALTEATRGTPGISIKKLLTYCFDYEPEANRYMFNSFRLFAALIIASLAIFIVFLVRRKPV